MPSGRVRRRIVADASWLLTWIVLFLLWALLVGRLDAADLVLGIPCAALGTLASRTLRQHASIRVTPAVRTLRAAAGVPARIVADLGIVSVALWQRATGRRRARGAFHTVPLGDRSEARRFLAVIAGSMAPGAYLIGVNESEEAVVHSLDPRSLASVERLLEAT